MGDVKTAFGTGSSGCRPLRNGCITDSSGSAGVALKQDATPGGGRARDEKQQAGMTP